ncbi:PaaI family thioesterase [Nocardia sp. NPDC020380]|uniref:PaaI family thioesterase n=1 Tax=Nocardia sp. NPDC020380 TaxID=3364309 RepID=UPI0037A49274
MAGVLAGHHGAQTVRVDFRRAVPVGAPLQLTTTGDVTALTDGEGTLLASAAAATLDLTVPPAPSWAEAKTASEQALSSPHRPVGDCYGCGAACAPGQGLRLFPWGLPDREIMASAWTPDPGLAGETGELPPENVWAALDCPGGIAAWHYAKMARGAVTAALTATQLRPVPAGAEYVSHAWLLGRDGRKHTVGVALSTADGELCALGEALWIEPRT